MPVQLCGPRKLYQEILSVVDWGGSGESVKVIPETGGGRVLERTLEENREPLLSSAFSGKSRLLGILAVRGWACHLTPEFLE